MQPNPHTSLRAHALAERRWKWRGTPLAQLTTAQLERAIDSTLAILAAMQRERQRRLRCGL